eukprot:m.163143 g.163143  ORF g.163143 m.163143 type:complete len:1611 (-) comp17683_c0_seq2:59-4891(-)
MFACCRVLALAAVVVVLSQPSDAAGSVVTELTASWSSTPLLLEASEHIATEAPSRFWTFVDKVLDVQQETASDKEVYLAAENVAKSLLAPLQFDFFKLSLAARAHSPRVQAHFQVANDRLSYLSGSLPDGDCAHFVDSDRGVACAPEELSALLNAPPNDNATTIDIFDFDHVHPGPVDDDTITAVLYSELGTPEFTAFHSVLSRLAAEGSVSYVMRHYVKDAHQAGPMRLSGYGVELAVKKTEYTVVDDSKLSGDDDEDAGNEAQDDDSGDDELDGFLFSQLRKNHPDLSDNLDRFREYLANNSATIKELKAWELQDTSLVASEVILQSPTPLRALRDISQNAPSRLHQMVSGSQNETIRKEIVHNQKVLSKIGLNEGDAMFLVNSLYLDVEQLDFFRLLQTIGAESRVMNGLRQLGVPAENIPTVMALSGSDDAESGGVKLDTRTPAVQFMNNMEKDPMYSRWPGSLRELLRPAMPGQLRYVARNLFNVVFMVDPTSKSSLQLVGFLSSLVSRGAPLRVGVVFALSAADAGTAGADGGVVFGAAAGSGSSADEAGAEPDAPLPPKTAATALVRAFEYARDEAGMAHAFKFITLVAEKSDTVLDLETIEKAFVNEYDTEEWESLFAGGTPSSSLVAQSATWFEQTGVGKDALPAMAVNGHLTRSVPAQGIDQRIFMDVMGQMPALQRDVYTQTFTDDMDAYDYVMKGSVTRLNAMASDTSGAKVDITGQPRDVATHDTMPVTDLPASMLPGLVYLAKPGSEFVVKGVTFWVVADLDTTAGQRLAFEALQHQLESSVGRVALFHNPAVSNTEATGIVPRLVSGILASHSPDPAIKAIGNLLATAINTPDATQDDLLTAVKESKRQKVLTKADAETTVLQQRVQTSFCRRTLSLKPGVSAVVVNTRLVGPLEPDTFFVAQDFGLMEAVELSTVGAQKVVDLVQELKFSDMDPDDDTSSFRSTLVVQIASLLANARPSDPLSPQTRRLDPSLLADLKYEASAVHAVGVSEGFDGPGHDIIAVLDPLSKAAQKLAPLIAMLQNATAVNIRVLMNPVQRVSDVPVKRFYRSVMPKLVFSKEGSLESGPLSVFNNLPAAPLLTLGMDTPSSWMAQSVRSRHDLDNIHLASAGGVVRAEFALQYILVEGSCVLKKNNRPAQGLQFQLGTAEQGPVFDTIVMANLGYFQLKARPGAWQLYLRPGKSKAIFEIASHDGTDSRASGVHPTIVLNEFSGKFTRITVKRRKGMEKAKLLDDDGSGDDVVVPSTDGEADEGTGLWGALSRAFGSDDQPAGSAPVANKGAKAVERSGETINVFSLASGHLYERFMKIMMLSVLEHTKNPVKFWLIETPMSPQFKAFLPYMAQEYGFEYEFVQYNWPAWLTKQSEKQRLIWGYKILFLDVLFPLDVKKIIFVDADQVVRADLKELLEIDLEGAPYGYTPFCSSRKEMSGFRFWDSGYWASHLAGKPYHISALYVVDLVRFRQFAAGDRLREQYQGLSRDPNSLSNLDQDLPNNMVHQVPIKSLPQEWLWCETWCDDESKATAKTIDLCNNPLTKEPKLKAAVRIVPEWTGYDNAAREITERFEAEQARLAAAGDEGDKETPKNGDKKETPKHAEL